MTRALAAWLLVLFLAGEALAAAGCRFGGLNYRAGFYPTLHGSSLVATSLVARGPKPAWDPADPNAGNVNFILAGAGSNRSAGSAEFYVNYFAGGSGVGNSMEILAWSCTPSFPCPKVGGGTPLTAPGWVWDGDQPVQSYPEYLFAYTDAAGHLAEAIRYVNERVETVPATTFEQRVLLWNKRTNTFDLIWSHSSNELPDGPDVGSAPDPPVKDCSPGCGNDWTWLLETVVNVAATCTDAYALPQPPWREIGYESARITHDGGTSDFAPAESAMDPQQGGVPQRHLSPNNAFAAGHRPGPIVRCREWAASRWRPRPWSGC